MGILINKVIAGDYKGADVKYKIIGRKVILANIGFLKGNLDLNKRTVDYIELVDKSTTVIDFLGHKTVQVAIYFRDGKRSLVSLSEDAYQELNRVMF